MWRNLVVTPVVEIFENILVTHWIFQKKILESNSSRTTLSEQKKKDQIEITQFSVIKLIYFIF